MLERLLIEWLKVRDRVSGMVGFLLIEVTRRTLEIGRML
jgi:hypothetical protein